MSTFGCRFSSGFQLPSFVTSCGLLPRSWNAINSPSHAATDSNVGVGVGLSWKVHKEPDSDLTTVAFEATAPVSTLQPDLVPSSALKQINFHHFEFLCTDKSPLYVNKAAVNLFYENRQKLDQLKSELLESKEHQSKSKEHQSKSEVHIVLLFSLF